jgi:uncharacterized protein YndB with AHSA1/START domain
MKELIVKKEITLNADTSRVWEALVNPELTKLYMFGCKVVSDWKVGSKIQWKGISKGKEKIYIEGIIIKIEPGKILRFAIINSDTRYVDIPSNYIQVTYKLSRKFGKTELSITQGDYSKVEDSKRRYNEADEGLEYTLDGLKSAVEGKIVVEKKTVVEEKTAVKEKQDQHTTHWLPD